MNFFRRNNIKPTERKVSLSIESPRKSSMGSIRSFKSMKSSKGVKSTNFKSTKVTSPLLENLPQDMIDFHALVMDWIVSCNKTKDSQCFTVPQSLDGEEMAFMFNMSLNSNGRYKFEVLYIEICKTVFIRVLEQPKSILVPRVRVLGKV